MNTAKTQEDLQSLVMERRKVQELTLRAESAERLLDLANGDLAAYRARATELGLVAERVKTAEQTAMSVSTSLQTQQSRVTALLECLRWVRDRDRTWRGVAIDAVNKQLDEVIGGTGS